MKDFTSSQEKDGLFIVDGIRAVGEPSTRATLEFTIRIKDRGSYANHTLVKRIELHFRRCEEGEEYLDTGECRKCESGYYLLAAPS